MSSESTQQQPTQPRPPPASKLENMAVRPTEPEHLPCPRCGSTITKFCYYNNYNLSQPRHFCKACRRYWTRGGTLRNVPVGGGTRKSSSTTTKRSRNTTTSTTTSAVSPCSSSSTLSQDPIPAPAVKPELDFGSLFNLNETAAAAGNFKTMLNPQQRLGFLPLPEFGLGLGLNGMGCPQLGTWDWPMEQVGADGSAADAAAGAGCNMWQVEGDGGDGYNWPELAISAPGKGLK